jgi:7,8-dihydropterin-6-yl-methyl-4-(beta-D-ribofuranosyl)aminobenzene 5'-phosphate synthase
MQMIPDIKFIVLALVLIAVARLIYLKNRQKGNLKREAREAAGIIEKSNTLLADSGSGTGTRFTVLVENHRDPRMGNIRTGHGISLLVTRGKQSFLLDLGPGDLFARNAEVLEKNLSDVAFAFISHGHDDHGGGLETFLKLNRTAPVYLKKNAIDEKHYAKKRFSFQDISIRLGADQNYSSRLHFIDEMAKIDPGILIIPCIKQTHPLPSGNRSLYKKTGGSIVPDDFDHEQILAIQDPDGLIVFSGCCHNGVLNVVETVNRHFDNIPVKAMIGGFHLFNPRMGKMAETPESVINLSNNMLELQVGKYLTGHCTGTEAYKLLKTVLKDRLEYFSAGLQFTL